MAGDPLVGRVLADRFEIRERIGEGGTGVVYRARQLSVDRDIAIKILGAHVSTDPQWVKRFHNEARAASRLSHPNTVQLIDFGQTKEGLLFIAMELLHGRSLRTEIERSFRLPTARVLRIVSQMCASLGEAHGQGIIHRDIKPDNVYLVEVKGAGDYVKVLDFSVAKLDTPDAQVTRAGVVFGTPAYMSPEQGRGIKLDARSDVYAVGIVMYEMLGGKPPFDAQNPTDVVLMHLQATPPPLPSDVPQQVAREVMRALEKDPNRRHQTAEELDHACQAAMADLYPRQTPGSGLHQQLSAPNQPVRMQPQAAPQANTMIASSPKPKPVADQRTLLADAPKAVPVPEQRTQMAMPAPQQPVRGATPIAEQRTMMAAAPTAAPRGVAEQKTMMGMQAPVLPPPPNAPPPAGPNPNEQRTQMAMPAPSVGQSDQRTQMAMSAPIPSGRGTMVLPESSGVVAFAEAEAARVREEMNRENAPAEGSVLFWIVWVLIGLAGGLGYHFYLLQRLKTGQ